MNDKEVTLKKLYAMRQELDVIIKLVENSTLVAPTTETKEGEVREPVKAVSTYNVQVGDQNYTVVAVEKESGIEAEVKEVGKTITFANNEELTATIQAKVEELVAPKEEVEE